jgi:hypothetical protein
MLANAAHALTGGATAYHAAASGGERAARVARATRWRRCAPAGVHALASVEGTRRFSRGHGARDSAPQRQIMSYALSVPQESTEEEEESDDISGSSRGAPKILRFNGDKINLHNSVGNGSARRAAAGASPPPAPSPSSRTQTTRKPRHFAKTFPVPSLALAR